MWGIKIRVKVEEIGEGDGVEMVLVYMRFEKSLIIIY